MSTKAECRDPITPHSAHTYAPKHTHAEQCPQWPCLHSPNTGRKNAHLLGEQINKGFTSYSGKSDLNTSQGKCLSHNGEGKNPNRRVQVYMTPFMFLAHRSRGGGATSDGHLWEAGCLLTSKGTWGAGNGLFI